MMAADYIALRALALMMLSAPDTYPPKRPRRKTKS